MIQPQARGFKQTRAILAYHQHALDLEDLLDFVELTAFTKRWAQLGMDDESDLTALQLMIMANPQGAPVVPGAGGLRKLRFARDDRNVGKSGGLRVLYAHFEQFGIVLLCLVYSHAEADDLSEAGKKRIAQLIAEAEQRLRQRGTI
ncbi:MAG: hypothetical protein ACRCT8_03660 [Lacipirellulaceae bacterium]